jgi:hypothetical protein
MYFTSAPNEPILIRDSEPIEFSSDRGNVDATASVEFRWLPKPQLFIQCECEKFVGFQFFKSETCVLTIPSFNTRVDFIPIRISENNGTSVVTLVSKSGLIEKQSRSKMARVIFYLPNMPSFLRLQQEKLHLQAGDWQIVISPVNNIQEQVEQLKKLGGYAITYVGEIKRSDDKLFNVKEVNELLTCLHYFFSFIMGSWVAPLFPIGYDDHDSIVWEQWGVRRTDSWLNIESWLDWHHHDSISALLPGFWRKWNVEVWQKAIESSIYWYVQSNTQKSGIDGSIILTQTAFEILSWTTYVRPQGGLSPNSFEKLPAEDKLRMLLVSAGIELEVPTELTELKNLVTKPNGDGAQAFVKLRNSIVHPGDEISAGNVVFEAWLLGLRYFELILLHLFNYKGVYAYRLQKSGRWVGDVKQVPWTEEIRSGN